MNSILPVYFPEWQGYAVDNSVMKGAELLYQELKSDIDFEMIHVEEQEHLEEKQCIVGYDSIHNSFLEFKGILESNKPNQTFLLGGTCGSELAPVSYLNKLYKGDLAVLWFDAHGDLNTPQSSESKHFHGMPLRTLLGEGNEGFTSDLFSYIKPEQIVLVGGRDLDPPEVSFIEEARISLLTPADLQNNPNSIVEEIQRKGFTNVYLHLDLDILDPGSFPHLLLHVPNGIKIGLLTELVTSIKEAYPIVGSSLLEFVQRGEGGIEEVKELIRLLTRRV